MRAKTFASYGIKCNLKYGGDADKKQLRAFTENEQAEIEYCQFKCPHPNEECKGDCDEFKKWRKLQKKKG